MTREELLSLYEATAIERDALFDRINDKGSVTISKGSEVLAIVYAYEEALGLVWRTLAQKEETMRRLADA